jgi:hemerythrin-like domain-containing protein
MKPTDLLSSEHRVIEQVLDSLESLAKQCRSRGSLDEQVARDAIDFFRNFADRCHHAKEEAHLFPAMEAKGFPRNGGPTGVMMAEHEEGRACVRAMDEAVQAAGAGDTAAPIRFADLATRYIDLLRAHIGKEDHCLFAMANQAFSESDQQKILDVFTKVEAEEVGTGVHERYLKLADDLANRMGVTGSTAAATSHPKAFCGH